jgi:hypothetical protein
MVNCTDRQSNFKYETAILANFYEKVFKYFTIFNLTQGYLLILLLFTFSAKFFAMTLSITIVSTSTFSITATLSITTATLTKLSIAAF